MNVPIQFVSGGVLRGGGLVTAWIGPDLNEDGLAASRTPRQRLMIRLSGIALAAYGLALIVAALLGFHPPERRRPADRKAALTPTNRLRPPCPAITMDAARWSLLRRCSRRPRRLSWRVAP